MKSCSQCCEIFAKITSEHFREWHTEPVALGTLLETRELLVKKLQRDLDANERKFLISLVTNAPLWELLGIEHLAELPAIRWKVQNLEQLQKSNPEKHAEQSEALQRLLDETRCGP